MKNIINKTAIYLLLGIGLIVAACNDKNDWAGPGPEIQNSNPGVYFDMELSPVSAEMDPFDLAKDSVILILGRDDSQIGAALELPVTIVNADEGLTIPQSVTFAAGAATARLRINVDMAKVMQVEALKYTLAFSEDCFNTYGVGGVNRFEGDAFVPQAVTPENIATYVQKKNVRSIEAFLNEGTARYDITLMSDTLETWRQSYQEYSDATLAKPFTNYSIYLPRGDYQLAIVAKYSPSGLWYWGPASGTAPVQGLFPMGGTGNNPLSDCYLPLSRSSNSSAPAGYNANGTGAQKFRTFIQKKTGFTIIRDRDNKHVFWFRDKQFPNNWFKCERYSPAP